MGSQQKRDPDPTYFTCTLGQAQVFNSKTPLQYETINDFIEYQFHHNSDLPALCFPEVLDKPPPDGGFSDGGFSDDFDTPTPKALGKASTTATPVYTFQDLMCGSVVFASRLSSLLNNVRAQDVENQCVALLCPSSISFLFTWLGLMRIGCSVLLIAPQCTPAMIASLCKSCDVSFVFYAESLEGLAKEAACEDDADITLIPVPWQERSLSLLSRMRGAAVTTMDAPKRSKNDVAFIFHTSGSSSGMPKPIPQTHHAAVGVLPRLDGSKSATFTTTPLYHGGIADCFRAWTSNAMIWLFPALQMPITSDNIVRCLATAKSVSDYEDWIPSRVEYFSSVPYVLQMLSEYPAGLKWLQHMAMVGVGGAALPQNIGDELVQGNVLSKGVNLVSRFGSAECGFLLSSHRDYDTDKGWQYLRQPSDSQYLRFEEQTDGSGLYELVILKGWPHMARTNRPSGDLATSDLFKPHPSIPNAWKVDSRSDSQIALVTGKKFDPAPIEDNLASSSTLIRDVLIFGSGRAMPGAFIFPSEQGDEMDDDQLLKAVWKQFDKLNIQGQEHTRVSQSMIKIMSKETEPLPKSSKGTILRGVAEKIYKRRIESMYDDEVVDGANSLSESEVLPMVRKIVRQVLGGEEDIDDDAELYRHGVDSSKTTQIRNLITKEINLSGKKLPFNVVYDSGNMKRLAGYIIKFRKGKVDVEKGPPDLMFKLSNQAIGFIFHNYTAAPREERQDDPAFTVLLTGSTGVLGVHILNLLVKCSAVKNIFCLVRATSSQEAASRVDESLKKRLKWGLDQDSGKIQCFPADLRKPQFGLEDSDFLTLKRDTNLIIHAAWNVNFSLPLESFARDIDGLANLLHFSLRCKRLVRFLFCSSTASVMGADTRILEPEKIFDDPRNAGVTGYARSKWVAEAICGAYSKEQTKGDTVATLRIGQLTADTTTGVWNMSEAWPLMLRAGHRMKILPDLDEYLSWLPVNIAAEAVIQIAMPPESCIDKGQAVYHLVNNSTETNWEDLLHWLPWDFKIVSPKEWLEQLEELGDEKEPAKALLGLWKQAYGELTDGPVSRRSKNVFPPFNVMRKFDTAKAEKIAPVMKRVSPIDGPQIVNIGRWIEGDMKKEEERKGKLAVEK